MTTGITWQWLVVSYVSPPGRVFAAEVMSWTASGDPVIAYREHDAEHGDGAQLSVVPLARVRGAYPSREHADAAVERHTARQTLLSVI